MSKSDKATHAEGLEKHVKAGIEVAVDNALAKSQKATQKQLAEAQKETQEKLEAAQRAAQEAQKATEHRLAESAADMSGMKDDLKALMQLVKGMAEDKKTKPEQEQEEPKPNAEPKSQRVDTSFKPDELTLDYTLAEFKTWRKRFLDYRNMNRMSNFDEGQQACHIRSCMSMRTQDHMRIYMDLGDDAKPDEMLEVLDRYFNNKSNVASRRVEFSNCKQRGGESFEEFFVRLSLLQEDSDPCQHCQEMQLITRVIAGVADRRKASQI